MLIDGPVNIVRIEGKINNIDKILYIFFDQHNPVVEQTQCDSYESVNITKFLYNIFKNISRKLDFFLEIRTEQFKHYDISNYNKMYIHENIKLYNKIKNHKFKNTRLHYLDIRDILLKGVNDSFNWFVFNDPLHDVRNSKILYYDIFTNYLYHIKNLKKRILFIESILINIKNNDKYKSKLKSLIPNGKKNIEQSINYIIYKLYYRYNHEDTFYKFKKSYTEQILDQIIVCLDYIDKIIDLLMKNQKFLNNKDKIYFKDLNKLNNLYSEHKYTIIDSIINDLDYLTSRFRNNILSLFVLITDLFFIRRFIDKDYIQFTITYTGGTHSINYIYNLIKYFDFKITNASYSDISIDELNIMAKKDNIYNFGYQLETIHNDQCSNITTFPKEFL